MQTERNVVTSCLSAGGLEITEAVAEQCCEAAKANASLFSVHQLLKVRMHYTPLPRYMH